jgi:DNA-directed RNA polymerase specialized sigma54-like protein
MQKLIRSFLSASRKRRILATDAALWLLRQVYDVESDKMHRCLDKLDLIDSVDDEGFLQHEYDVVEEEHSDSECAVSHLDSAIEDLEYAYCGRF